MVLIITINEIQINTIRLDYQRQVVIVSYSLMQDTGEVWKNTEAYFWVIMPDSDVDENGISLPIPENWFLLPAEYFPTLLALRDDADTALTNHYLIDRNITFSGITSAEVLGQPQLEDTV